MHSWFPGWGLGVVWHVFRLSPSLKLRRTGRRRLCSGGASRSRVARMGGTPMPRARGCLGGARGKISHTPFRRFPLSRDRLDTPELSELGFLGFTGFFGWGWWEMWGWAVQGKVERGLVALVLLPDGAEAGRLVEKGEVEQGSLRSHPSKQESQGGGWWWSEPRSRAVPNSDRTCEVCAWFVGLFEAILKCFEGFVVRQAKSGRSGRWKSGSGKVEPAARNLLHGGHGNGAVGAGGWDGVGASASEGIEPRNHQWQPADRVTNRERNSRRHGKVSAVDRAGV
eukprot:TRINITY_DN5212_c0_g2_i3.p1 TRINITY_DN5212_c0_g2~~TRINITY_DN5212_c0_g2_i3.p1  ORF type:complete len:282 (-),score=-28.04 TRINITY_DN5212_c0_g2_i3:293-1138(-)